MSVVSIRRDVTATRDVWKSLLILAGFLSTIMIVLSIYQWQSYTIRIEGFAPPHTIDERFMSFGIDSSFVKENMKHFTDKDWATLTNMTKIFKPGYLRLGGTDADRIIFNDDISGYITLTNTDWLKINDFAYKTGLSLIYDFNVLLRAGERWNYSNALQIMKFTKDNNYPIHFQLGNEPDAYLHVFNFTLPPKEFGKDFNIFNDLIRNDSFFKNSKLVGPDVTRPIKTFTFPALVYLKRFLEESYQSLDAISWHHYYFNGRNATEEEFVNPDILDTLQEQIIAVKQVTEEFTPPKPIWLGETGSAFGGGAPNLSNRYAATFLCLDKLGLSAKMGVDVIIRQSLYRGHYALINDDFTPTPDFWVSLLYKKLVGNEIYSVRGGTKHLRLYAQSTVSNLNCLKNPDQNVKLVVFGINIGDSAVHFTVKDITHFCAAYVFTSDSLSSPVIKLNGVPLDWDSVYPYLNNFTQQYAVDSFSKIPPLSSFFLLFA